MTLDWSDLQRELDHWQAMGRTAELWWRDDDAIAATPALDRLLDLVERHKVPILLAVIPMTAEASLAAALRGAGGVAVAQHGIAHVDHAGPGGRKVELGGERSRADLLRDLDGAADRLAETLSIERPAVLVPPWNRVDGDVLPDLPKVGFSGLSRYNPRSAARAAPGLKQVNTHVDVIDWRGSRGFVGLVPALELLCGHLAAKRQGQADPDEPTGLLTHHLVHDEPVWRFLDRLFTMTAGHPACRWLAGDQVFDGESVDQA